MSSLITKLGSYLVRARQLLRTFFFVPPPVSDFSFEEQEVAQLHTNLVDSATMSIDDQTWDDLFIHQYATTISEGVSIFGKQVLYRRLRIGADEPICGEHRAVIKRLMADKEQLSKLDEACQPLRRKGTEIASLLFGPQEPNNRPQWTYWIGLLGPCFFLAFGASFIWPLAWGALAVTFALLLIIRSRYIVAVEIWSRSIDSLQGMLSTFIKVGESDDAMVSMFAESRDHALQINRRLSRSPIALLPGVKEYVDWFMLGNVRHYFHCTSLVHANIDHLRKYYLLVANLDANIALARHLQSMSVFCWADRRADPVIQLHSVINPLLPHGVPLSIDLADQGAFISGQNGIGKSTLLRTIGLNLVAARAFGICYAREAIVSNCPVYASMQSEDAMLSGESLYIAELRRAKEMLASSYSAYRGIYIIDEIFRGTNHLESVSAAAAVLHELASKNLVVVSSHNVVLAPLLSHCLKALYVSASSHEHSRLTLLPGVLVDTNGIALLRERGFDVGLQDKANKVFDWLSGYLAYPKEFDAIRMSIQS